MSNTTKVNVTRDDVRDVVVRKSAHVPAVLVDAVVSELNKRLGLVCEHDMTTALRGDTVQPWIELRIEQELGDAAFDEILKNNVSE